MRRVVAVVVVFLCLVCDLGARSRHDWSEVKKVKHGTSVVIYLWNGDKLRGRIDSVADKSLRLAVPDPMNPQASWIHAVDRVKILRIMRTPHPPNLPDPSKAARIGAIAGGATGLVAGAISDARHDYQGRWVLGGFVGALSGAMVGIVAVGTIGIAETLPALVHHDPVIYEDSDPGAEPPNSAPQALEGGRCAASVWPVS